MNGLVKGHARRRGAAVVAVAVAVLGLAPLALAAPVGEITVEAEGGVTPGMTAGANPTAITVGPDGNMWFTYREETIARRNADGSISEFPVGFPGVSFPGIVAGPDGNVWFVGFESPGTVARATPEGAVTAVATGGITPGFADGNLQDIVLGPDGNLWVTRPFGALGGSIARVTPTGTVTEFPVPAADPIPRQIVAGPDGNLWFSDSGVPGRIWSATTDGAMTVEAEAGVTPGFPAGSAPRDLVFDEAGDLWFTEVVAPAVARLVPDGDVTLFTDPELGFIQSLAYGCGNVWLTQGEETGSASLIWQIEPDGTLTPYADGMPPTASPAGITTGPDPSEDEMWVTGFLDPGWLLSIGTGCEPSPTPDEPGSSDSAAPVAPTAVPASAVATEPAFTG